MPKKISKAWKSFERRVANFFNTTRTPLSGGNSKVTRSDTFHPHLFIECKTRKSFAFHTTYKDAKEKAKKEGKLPILITQEKGSHGFLISLHCDDLDTFLNLYNKIQWQKRNLNKLIKEGE